MEGKLSESLLTDGGTPKHKTRKQSFNLSDLSMEPAHSLTLEMLPQSPSAINATLQRVRSITKEMEVVPKAPWDVDRPRAVRAMLCCMLVLGMCALLENTFTLYASHIAEFLEVEQAATSVAFTILVVTYAGSGPAFSQIGARYGLHCLILMSAIFIAVSSLGLSRVQSVAELYLYYFLGGLGIGAVFAPCTTACILLMPPEKQGTAAGVASLSYLSGSVVASAPVAWLIQSEGFHMAYLAQGAVACCLICAAFFTFPRDNADDEQKDEAGPMQSIDESPHSPQQKASIDWGSFIAIYMAFLATATTYYAVEANVQPILESCLPAKSPVLLYAVPVGLVMNGGARLFWGSLAGKMPATRSLSIASVCAIASLLLWAQTYGSPTGGFLGSALAFFCTPAFWSTMPIAVMRIYGEDRAAYLFALLTTADIGSSIIGAPVVALLAARVGWPVCLELLTIPAVVCALILTFLVPPEDMTAETAVVAH